MDADPAVSADLVLVALDAPRSHPPPALPCHVTRAGPPPVGPVRSTPERTITASPKMNLILHLTIITKTIQFVWNKEAGKLSSRPRFVRRCIECKKEIRR